ncbi:MAG TPA: hypothetical protein VIR32_05615 [Lachnospiraceae bacterium]
MKENKCTLCGGKLKNGICTDCGMDNRRSDSHYEVSRDKASSVLSNRENISGNKRPKETKSPVQERYLKEKNKSAERAKVQQTGKKTSTYSKTAYQRLGTNNARKPVSAPGLDKRHKEEKKGKVKKTKRWISIAMLILLPLMSFLKSESNELSNKVSTTIEMVNPSNWSTFDFGKTEALSPEQAEEAREKKEEELGQILFSELETKSYVIDESRGSRIEAKISSGEYIVGKDIPEGVYEIEATKGYGIVYVNLGEDYNLATEFLVSQNEEDMGSLLETDISRARGVPLINGASIYVDPSLEISLISDCAREDLLKAREANPLKEKFTIKSEESVEDFNDVTFYRAGEDFKAGVYDIVLKEGGFASGISQTEDGGNMQAPYGSFTLSSAEGESSVLHHVNIKEGVEIGLSNQASIELVPSEYGE